ncbi:MAG: hypothetical protein Q8N09_12090 [Thermodesulfovibrionia bacterium]|nr:hypothetical protein [Thermodesulfovibrionia bacterium]
METIILFLSPSSLRCRIEGAGETRQTIQIIILEYAKITLELLEMASLKVF